MSVIYVDIENINNAKNLVDEYVTYQTDTMKQANNKVSAMNENWTGTDYKAFDSKWNNVVADSSIVSTIKTELESFSKYLNRCSTEYTALQNSLQSIATTLF